MLTQVSVPSPSGLRRMDWQDLALGGPSKPLPGTVPDASYALRAHGVIFYCNFFGTPNAIWLLRMLEIICESKC